MKNNRVNIVTVSGDKERLGRRAKQAKATSDGRRNRLLACTGSAAYSRIRPCLGYPVLRGRNVTPVSRKRQLGPTLIVKLGEMDDRHLSHIYISD